MNSSPRNPLKARDLIDDTIDSLNYWFSSEQKLTKKPQLTVNHIRNAVDDLDYIQKLNKLYDRALLDDFAMRSQPNLIVFKNSETFPVGDRNEPVYLVNYSQITSLKEESMIHMKIRNCENGFIVAAQFNYGAAEKEYVAANEKELAKLVERLAKEAKAPKESVKK